MAGQASLLPNPSDPSTPLVAVNFANVTELTPSTYRAWSRQIEDLLFGYDLFKYLDTSHPCPSSTIEDATSKKQVPNPAHATWLRQDRLLSGAIRGTINSSITPLLLTTKTASEIWNKLRSTYASQSRGHILQIKDRLRSISKGTSSATDYMQSIRTCVDELAHMGKGMDDEDIIAKVLDGLDTALYRSLIDAIKHRDTLISFDALHERLLQFDLSLKSTPPSSTPASALVAYHRNPPRQSPRPSTGLLPLPSGASVHASSASSPAFKGKCQWCHTTGHYLSLCHAFKTLHPTIHVPPRNPLAAASNRPYQPRANTASLAPLPANWVIDSGATHHITHDLANLALHAPYDGNDDLLIGDGSPLQITNTGPIDGTSANPGLT
ncbi:hypothetical protein KSS87_004494 [Heliosperma pusillum]|nr:hypothetical protein KSS87_004494 [Heliosperma pusillum]